jgi:hypothetical protein
MERSAFVPLKPPAETACCARTYRCNNIIGACSDNLGEQEACRLDRADPKGSMSRPGSKNSSADFGEDAPKAAPEVAAMQAD